MSQKEIFKGKIFTVYQKEMDVNGQMMMRDLVVHPGGAAISVIADHKILLVRQTPEPVSDVCSSISDFSCCMSSDTVTLLNPTSDLLSFV